MNAICNGSDFAVPIRGLTDDAVGTGSVIGDVTQDRIRIFCQEDDNSIFTLSNHIFAKGLTEAALQLGFDTCETRRPWGMVAEPLFAYS
jgi:hypothetical protein